ncbi:hypothetical protein N7470_003572 [Penicillium chermesinum]|nr:hypothetical protein N7470_003572 [Penicillium chermesinum]
MLFLLLSLPILTTAVTIRNYNHPNCQGRYEQCSDINENVCCDRAAGRPGQTDTSFGSSAYNSLPAAGLGLSCQTLGRSQHCGQVVDASWGDSACAGRGGELTGSFWFTCQGCPFQPAGGSQNGTRGPVEGDSEAVYVSMVEEGVRRAWEHEIGAVKPDVVGIDGRAFRVNYGVPEHVTNEIYAVFEDMSLGYKNFPADVMEFEILPMSDYEVGVQSTGVTATVAAYK